ncbi:restriction endonuclease subunit S [Aquiflexum gelatinilyticum]|uniref:Restriction endonuclease subunit S n=1 Tax=Aquiflexum gelatinilyticum TaxID=2961943 RepID=A0A9X2SYR7_9BACT|nr:restriction endonuclease subunit S [Aquiflexum gelatinilyticum]MCR9015722.1 restriction endonuclease subunit S [Aquiflexum gelatinilyticum]
MDNLIMESKVLNIDKSNWKLTKLGDLLEDISQRVDNPSKSGYDRFVGLEHFVSGDIKIKNWGTTENLTSSTKAFKAGDILFARRNAYLRRASLVDFDGCCSGDAFVLRENHVKVVPGFMAFFFNSNTVWDFANENAAGTMSQRVKWRDLAEYEFLLPPKDEQARLAELLWSLDEVIEKEKEVLERLEINLDVRGSHLIWNEENRMEEVVKFASANLKKFVDGDWIESKDQSDSGIRLLQLADIGVREFINKSSRFISEETFKRLRCFEVLPNDVLIARMPDPIGRACIIENIGHKMITAVDCCIVRVESSHSYNRYLLHLLNTREFLHKANLLASGTTRQRIARKSLEEIKVPKPSLECQFKIANELDSLYEIIGLNRAKIRSSESLQKSLINQIF